ncbi:hypothetical protein Trydic_g18529, partial [Trypoxylus dichotomus]
RVREKLEDDDIEEVPISVRTPEITEKIRGFIGNDRNASLKMMKDDLNII